MATPDSSATSPSPPMTFFSQTALPPLDVNLVGVTSPLSTEHDDRTKAVEKFRERARLSSVTRALRARLAYASFKATHNIPQVSLRELEESSNQPNAASGSRTIAAKRKTGVTTINAAGNNHSGSAGQPSGSKRAPASQASSRGVNYYPTFDSTGSLIPPNPPSTSRVQAYPPSPANNASPYGQSLYASLLAIPPANYARTIHNPSDPPPPAPVRQIDSPRNRPRDAADSHAPVKSIAEGTRAHTKGRSKDLKSATPKTKRTPKGKQKRSARRTSGGTNDTDSVDGDGDIDMKAAAALTSLLMHNHRGSASLSVGAGSASSPRSSIDGAASEAGSAASYSHYMQSSARSFSDTAASSQTLVPEGALIRPHTPAGSVTSESRVTTTPRPDPTDNEAADLMLFLATSPSPARPTTNKERNNRDLAAFRTLSTNNDRPKGRVLFATTPAPPGPILEDSHGKSLPIGQAKPLARGGASEASLASSMSSIGSYMGVEPSSRPANVVQKSGRSTPTSQPPSQLLPPPSFSAPRHTINTVETKPASPHSQNPYPPSNTTEFNINEFINASPSPRTNKTSTSHFDPSGAPKPNLSLRADVGRKLFEEEQIRLNALRGLGPDGMGASLGAGIDLSS